MGHSSRLAEGRISRLRGSSAGASIDHLSLARYPCPEQLARASLSGFAPSRNLEDRLPPGPSAYPGMHPWANLPAERRVRIRVVEEQYGVVRRSLPAAGSLQRTAGSQEEA